MQNRKVYYLMKLHFETYLNVSLCLVYKLYGLTSEEIALVENS
jgi:hypothetical protein